MKAIFVLEAINESIKFAEKEIEKIRNLNTKQLTYKNSYERLDRSLERLDLAWSYINHLENINSSKELRNVYADTLPIVTDFYTKIPLDSKLWKVLKSFKNNPKFKKLSKIKKRHVLETIQEFKLNGAKLNHKEKILLSEINRKLAILTQKYSENCLDDLNDWETIVNDPKRLTGIPYTITKSANEDCVGDGTKENWRFTLNDNHIESILKYAEDEQLRKEVWLAYQKIGRKKKYNNKIIVIKILNLRDQLAKLLKIENFAQYITKNRMLKNTGEVNRFIDHLSEKVYPYFISQYKNLISLDLKKNKELNPWDLSYLSEKIRTNSYELKEDELRPYFEINNVLVGIFEIIEKTFDITIRTITPNKTNKIKVWHPSVKVYSAIDKKTKKQLGIFYTDWFPRKGKRAGAWMSPLRYKVINSKFLKKQSAAVICANLTPKTKNRPALLSHNEVQTLFHEFGHLLHHICGKVQIRSLNGTNVAWDFVELPSQLMENWCWEKESLYKFAIHYKTKANIPKKLLNNLIKSKNHLQAISIIRQLNLCKMDLLLHSDWPKSKQKNLDKYLHIKLKKYLIKFQREPLPITYNFNHLFGDPIGYASGYYSYKWSEVLEADIFNLFKEKGLKNKKLGVKFRKKILERGNSETPNKLFYDFMKRKPDINSLLRKYAINI